MCTRTGTGGVIVVQRVNDAKLMLDYPTLRTMQVATVAGNSRKPNDRGTSRV
jgi:hypothetical protein